MSRLNVHVGSSRLTRRGFRASFLLAVVASLSLIIIGSGCKHQTTAQLVDAEIKKRRDAEANLTTEEAIQARKEADEQLRKYTQESNQAGASARTPEQAERCPHRHRERRVDQGPQARPGDQRRREEVGREDDRAGRRHQGDAHGRAPSA